MRWITDNEIACRSLDDVHELEKVLLKNGYVVMVSAEENLFIVNFVWSEGHADRNDVVFESREYIEDIIFNPPEADE
jgi:hypothetical protein